MCIGNTCLYDTDLRPLEFQPVWSSYEPVLITEKRGRGQRGGGREGVKEKEKRKR